MSSTVAGNCIPADLIVKSDQIGVRMVPVNDWTMTTRGSKQVSVPVLGDMRDTFFSNTFPFLNWLTVDFVLLRQARRTNDTNL